MKSSSNTSNGCKLLAALQNVKSLAACNTIRRTASKFQGFVYQESHKLSRKAVEGKAGSSTVHRLMLQNPVPARNQESQESHLAQKWHTRYSQ